MINYIIYKYIYIYQFLQQNNFKISILLLILFLKVFFLHFYKLWSILSPPIFCVKISANISNISIKSKYWYIRNYRYFYPWLQETNSPQPLKRNNYLSQQEWNSHTLNCTWCHPHKEVEYKNPWVYATRTWWHLDEEV